MFRYKLVFVAVSIALAPLAWSQSPSAKIAVRSARATSIWNEIQVSSGEDAARVTPEYAEIRIRQLRATIQEQTIETLNQSDKPDDVKGALDAVIGGMKRGPDSPLETFAYFADLRGLKVVVIGFNVRYGGKGFGSGRAVLQGYRKIGLSYELAAEEEALLDCSLTLDRINSPRENELWLLAHGQVSVYMGYEELIRLYSFDGYDFKNLWASGPKINPEYKITKDAITVTSEDRSPDHPPIQNIGYLKVRDTILLTSGGPVVSTQTLLPK